MAEFTGERVVPGLVDDDLFNEHAARYRFAAKVAASLGPAPRVLDAGCGTGYGAAFFERATALDISAEALGHARQGGIRYVQGSCEALPFANGVFDLICAFEVIEHLERWQDLLTEARRVLKPGGLLLVSTPNQAYYAEVRAEAGPNPFHTHEFEFAEYRAALAAVFPRVRMWSQNHAASVVIAPASPAGFVLDAGGDTQPENAHFFLAACSREEIAFDSVYAWVPETGNVLRARERHIAKLAGELKEKDFWLERRAREHSQLHSKHERLLLELRERNEWALSVDRELEEARGQIRDLQNEAAVRLGWVLELEARILAGEAEIARLNVEREAETVRAELEIARLNAHREQIEADLAARAAWGFALDAEVQALSARAQALEQQLEQESEQHGAEREQIAGSKWMRLGRKLNLGPRLE